MQFCWFNWLYSCVALLMISSFCAHVHASPFPISPLGTSADPNNNSKVPILQIVFIGTVEGKSYFYDESSRMNWTEAKAHCNFSGLHLATITTAALLTFLNNSYSSGLLPYGYYWTGGREARQWRMFSWDQTNNELPSIFTGEIVSSLGPDYYACLEFQSAPNRLIMQKCTDTNYALCES